MRRLLLLVALLVAGCGGQGGNGVFERAQAGLARVTSGTIELRVTVQALVPIERSVELQAGEVPLAQLRLARWGSPPPSHRLRGRARLRPRPTYWAGPVFGNVPRRRRVVSGICVLL